MPSCVCQDFIGQTPQSLGGDLPHRSLAPSVLEIGINRFLSGRIPVINQGTGLEEIVHVPSTKRPKSKGFTVLGKNLLGLLKGAVYKPLCHLNYNSHELQKVSTAQLANNTPPV